MDVRTMIGQKLVFGFEGTVVPECFRQMVREYKIGNVILFRRNVESAGQLRALCAEIQALIMAETGHPAFIAIDQEGGMVTRLPSDAVNVPGSMALAATGDPGSVRQAAMITAWQLRGLGINLNLAPDLDVNCNPRNPVIGVRSFGDDPQKVAALGAEAVRGYGEGGVMCCGKHFPGHGDTAVDSHLGLPCIDKDMAELTSGELVPFREAIAAGIPAVMSSHILFPRLEPDGLPATMSRRIMHGLLREELGFDGLILSDCMVMDAIQKYYGTARGVVAAMGAGIDLVFVSSSEALQRESAEAALAAALNGTLDTAELAVSVARVLAAKDRYAFTAAEPGLASRPEDFAAARAMARQAITHAGGSLFPADEHTFFCGCADYRVTLAANEDADAAAFPVMMQRRFGCGCGLVSKDPSAEEQAEIVHQAAGYRRIVMSTCNAHLFRGQLALARALSETGLPMIAVALRNPYDLPLLPQTCGKLAAWDYSPDALSAVADVLAGGSCYGTMPVTLP